MRVFLASQLTTLLHMLWQKCTCETVLLWIYPNGSVVILEAPDATKVFTFAAGDLRRRNLHSNGYSFGSQRSQLVLPQNWRLPKDQRSNMMAPILDSVRKSIRIVKVSLETVPSWLRHS